MLKTVFSVLAVLVVMVKVLFAQDFTWENIAAENTDIRVLSVSTQESKIIFAGQPGNIFKSINGGKTWRRVLGVRGSVRNINALVMVKNDPNAVYAATDNGLYRSNNLGERWERIFRGKNSRESQCMDVGIYGQTILAGTKAGLYISRDNGRSWHKQEDSIGNRGILNIDFSLGEIKIIYLAAENGIFKSLDNGQNWERMVVACFNRDPGEDTVKEEDDHPQERPSDINFVKADTHNINLLYFSCAKGVYQSFNQGQSWEKLTEYGLLNRDVKMICLSENSQILALTSTGVFSYSGERWREVSFGLAAGQLEYLALDNLNNIYIAAEKGLYRSSRTDPDGSMHTSLIEEYLKNEPGIRELQAAAIRYAEVSPEKISQWRKGAAKKAWLPKVNIGLDRNSTDLWHWESGSTAIGQCGDDLLRRGRDSIDWDVSLAWDLGDLVWNDAQTAIDVRSKLMVELREDILDQLNKLYFERLRVKSELDNLALEDRRKRFDKQLKLEELTASLDALTSGYYSEQLRLLAAK